MKNMKVSDLLDLLSNMDPNAKVSFKTYEYNFAGGKDEAYIYFEEAAQDQNGNLEITLA